MESQERQQHQPSHHRRRRPRRFIGTIALSTTVLLVATSSSTTAAATNIDVMDNASYGRNHRQQREDLMVFDRRYLRRPSSNTGATSSTIDESKITFSLKDIPKNEEDEDEAVNHTDVHRHQNHQHQRRRRIQPENPYYEALLKDHFDNFDTIMESRKNSKKIAVTAADDIVLEEPAYLHSTTVVPYLLLMMLVISGVMLASISSSSSSSSLSSNTKSNSSSRGQACRHKYSWDSLMKRLCATTDGGGASRKELPMYHPSSSRNGGVGRSVSADIVRRRRMDTIVEEIRYLSD